MVNANEWLNKKIPAEEREHANSLCIYRKCICGDKKQIYRNNNYEVCQQCNNMDQDNYSNAPKYSFYNVNFEGELNLNDLVNLRELYIEGTEDRRQNLTSLRIDKCTKLTKITINYTTLGLLSLGRKPKLQSTKFIGNKRLNFCDSIVKNQLERLTSLILTKENNDLKLEIKKINEESLEYHLDVIKSDLDESNRLWVESLIGAQQEVLHNNSAYARKQIERCKKILSEVLTAEEIQDLLGKTVEINELEAQLNKLTLKE
ncbi:34307_t:CDS:1 [Gigaspora margarita]|uniref:34307_t:CDS:1 n=1 Tax=Gigaspora margarita TaxID=4874 RepID=A0ABN7VUW5_GIGMA|nr:34307_t:CDS:1 [Gigaspora margarita]